MKAGGSIRITFGCAATCLVLGTASAGAIAKISRLESFDWDDMSRLIRENEVWRSASFYPGTRLPVQWHPEQLGVSGVNIADYMGSLIESTLPTQVLFSMLYFKAALQLLQGKRILLIAQVGRARFEAFLLDVL